MDSILKRYSDCTLCARMCHADRSQGQMGYCTESDRIRIARAAPHFFEEPIISGTRGSGTIFFVGCSLGCIYCQNCKITAREKDGRTLTENELASLMLSLRDEGVHNINLVTPTHFVPGICLALDIARDSGLDIPVVYNTGSFDSVETIRLLKGRVDVYLADFKYYKSISAEKLSHAESYPRVAAEAIREMVAQVPSPIIEDGIMKRGVIVRLLLLPGKLAECKLTVKYLYETYGDSIYISLMSQYTPMPGMTPPLNRRVTRAEYRELVDYAERLGVKNGFTQDVSASSESFIPPFNSKD